MVMVWHGVRLALDDMRLSSGPESVAPRRGRRIVLALLILLLILLPLYLWPLRGGGGGLPSAAALSGLPRDPRDPAAVAHLPSDVWDGLMGRGAETAPKAPGNLTRIAEVTGAGPPDLASGGVSLPPRYDTLSRGRAITALPGDGADQSGGQSGGTGDTPPAPVQFLAGPSPSEGPGSGNSAGGGGYSGFPGNLGPFGGGGGPGGPSGSAPTFFSDAADPGPAAPTPEPTTILLVGSNLALLGAAVWRRVRRGEETGPGG